MTQYSWPWSTVTGLGDGSSELGESLSRSFLATLFKVQDPTVEGVSKGVLGELEVTGVASPLAVAAGSGICYGLYLSDAAENLTVSTPALGTTGGRIVLQTNWAGTGGASLEARTRLAVTLSTDGDPSIPALTQSVGVTWEISLATFTITTGGVIAVTDDRTFRKSTGMVDTAEIFDAAVTLAKLSAAVAAQLVTNGNSHDHVGGDGSPIGAGGLANGAVDTTARLSDDIVTDAKAGHRIGKFSNRQGGSTTGWIFTGTTNYVPTDVLVQMGAIQWTGVAAAQGQISVTFPTAFTYQPLVFLIVDEPSAGGIMTCWVDSILAGGTGFTAKWSDVGGVFTHTAVQMYWLAIGPG